VNIHTVEVEKEREKNDADKKYFRRKKHKEKAREGRVTGRQRETKQSDTVLSSDTYTEIQLGHLMFGPCVQRGGSGWGNTEKIMRNENST